MFRTFQLARLVFSNDSVNSKEDIDLVGCPGYKKISIYFSVILSQIQISMCIYFLIERKKKNIHKKKTSSFENVRELFDRFAIIDDSELVGF